VSTFYLLPPRSLMADHLGDWLSRALPGMDWDVVCRRYLLEMVCVAATRPGAYLVHRDELPLGECAERALRDGFGAEPGDEVVEVRMAARVGEFVSRRWAIGCNAETVNA
jgi:hypothetical protein